MNKYLGMARLRPRGIRRDTRWAADRLSLSRGLPVSSPLLLLLWGAVRTEQEPEDQHAAHEQRRHIGGHDDPVHAKRIREYVIANGLNDRVDRVEHPDANAEPDQGDRTAEPRPKGNQCYERQKRRG